MDGFEVNKILGALLGTALLIMALRNFGDAFFEKEPLEKNAFPVAVAASAGGGDGAAAPVALDIPRLLADAKPEHGARVAEKCLACHTIVKGGPNSTGPNLWGVVGGPTAHLGDAFAYSAAMKKFGGTWTYDRLFAFLENPQGYLSGTKMTFAGLSKPTDRADVIDYLRTQSDNPPALPTPTTAPAPAPTPVRDPAGTTPPGAPGPAGGAPSSSSAPTGGATAAPATTAPAPSSGPQPAIGGH